jgi:hypothetical protein
MGRPSIEAEDSPVVSSAASVSNDSSGAGSADEHPFSDPVVADRWRKVYENARYENRHRFDPTFKWTPEEEKKLVRKVRGCVFDLGTHLLPNILLLASTSTADPCCLLT